MIKDETTCYRIFKIQLRKCLLACESLINLFFSNGSTFKSDKLSLLIFICFFFHGEKLTNLSSQQKFP